jgi:glycosyltransferase involved in cell wall biosynthesis
MGADREKNMRIAIVSDYFLDYVGGAQSSIHEQKAALEEAGHEVLLIAHTRTGSESVDLSVRPAFTVPGVQLAVSYSRPALIALLTDFFASRQVDVVHLQTEFGLAHAAIAAARRQGIPVVHTVHTFYWQSAGIGPTIVAPLMRLLLQRSTDCHFAVERYTGRPSDDLLRSLTAETAKLVDVVISPSEHQGADLATSGVQTPLVVVPNPIARAARPAALLADDAIPRFLWVARCEPEKRPLVFAEAALAALGRAEFEVDFVGDGSQLDELRRLTANAPGIRVHGNLGHDEVLQLIDDSSIVVLTSNGFDNQPMTIAESVSRYRGVLFCDPKLREGLRSSGYLSADPSPEALAEAIVDLSTRPGALQRLSVGAREDAAIFSAATYVERIMAAYALAARA